jgi:uncharacterized protein YfaS (alpha-2-macroglobulin family)
MSKKEKDQNPPRRKIRLSSIFGTYTPPPYLTAIGSATRNTAKKIGEAVKARKKILKIAGLSLLGLFVVFIGFSFWAASQPRLLEVKCSINAPVPHVDEEEPISSVTFSFDGSAAKSADSGNDVSEGISISPAIEGVWHWNDDSNLSFTPKADWPIGTTYKVQFAKNFFPDHLKIKRGYSFATQNFEPSLSEGEFYIDPENGKIKRILATLSANYPIDPDSLEKNVVIKPSMLAKSGSLENRQYQYSITYDKLKLNAYISSEPLGMPVESVTVNLTVRKGFKSSLGGKSASSDLSTSVTVPGSSDYIRIDETTHELVKTPDQRYDQVIVISSNGDIDTAELMKNLSAWVLPKDRPDLPGLKGQKDAAWKSVDLVNDAVLKLSQPLALEPIPNEHTYCPVNSFRFKAPPGSYVYFKLKEGTRFYGDYLLKKAYQSVFRVKQYPKEVSILSDGAIVSLTGSKQIAMLTRDIGDVNLDIGRIRPDDINHLVSQSNGNLNSFSFEYYNFNEYNITEQYHEKRAVPVSGAGAVNYFSFDFTRYLDAIPEKNLRYGLFVFTARGGTDKTSQYQDKRIIMVTDLGFYVKSNTDKTKDVYVQSIGSGEPVSGATVSVLGLNGNPLVAGVTGGDGHVSIPDLSGYEKEKTPVAWTVRRGEDMSFMPWAADGRILDYSNFDTGGVTGATDPKKINAFLFSDRGIYRPGDAMHIGMIVKAGDWRISLERTPLECRIVDPKGTEVFTRKITLGAAGFEEISWKSQDYSPTGTYTASLYLIMDDKDQTRKFLGSETVKVEEFLPDNLNIATSFTPVPQAGWIHPDKLSGVVALRNLFGTAAAGNDVKAQISLFPGVQKFPKYRDFTFSDPYKNDKSYKEFLGTQQTDQNGSSSFPIDLTKFEKATYNLHFYAEGFEKGGGRHVSSETTVFVSPLDYLVGYKADGDLGYINRDSVRTVSFIAINSSLEQCAVSDLTASLAEIKYVSMLVKQPNGLYKYQSVRKSYPVKSDAFAIAKDGFTYTVPTATEGDYELTLTGKDGLEYNKVAWSVIGDQNVERSLTRTAELEVKLDRQDYRNGDTVKLFIKAPYAGAGLITIERDKVYARTWFKSNGPSSVQSIEVPADIEGNGYVTVMFTRSVSSKEIFMSPFCYASIPFSVSREKRTNHITIDVPSETKPGTDFAIKYSTSRPGKIAIMAIDEGILQVAGYHTPDPLAFFFKKRALEVGTAQIMDLILPEFNILKSLGAMGGDGAADELNRNLNPFKRKRNVPVAYWSGIIDSGPDVKTVHYRIPDYFNGSMRVMAVAVSDDTVGAAEEKVLVKNTYIISPNVPLMAAPGDEFDVSVTVTNNKKGSGQNAAVTLSVTSSRQLALQTVSAQKLNIAEGQDKTVSFRVKANNIPGEGELRFTASDDAESVVLTTSLSVRPAVPYRVTVASGTVKNGTSKVPVDRSVYEDFATRSVSVSYVPTGIAKGLAFYLEKYPYGCSEQITSATWPLLYPTLVKQLGIDTAQAKETIDRTISILQSRVREDGTIGLWTSNSESDLYLTNYCTLFLIDARSKGYYVPESLMSSCLSGVRTIASNTDTDEYSLAMRSYAIYIMTRSEIVTTQYIEKLKKDMKKNADAETGYAGLFLAGSYALLKQDIEAGSLLGKIKRDLKKDDAFRFADPLCYKSIYLDIIARHFPSRLRDVSADLLKGMAEELENQNWTTLSANHALMAIESYLALTPNADTGSFTASEKASGKALTEVKLAGGPLFSGDFSAGAKEIDIRNEAALSLFWQVTTAGFDSALPKTETKEGIEVYREFTDLSGNKATSFKTGDDILVKVNVRATKNGTINDVAVVDMLPAGLEPDISSIRNPGDKSNWQPDYIDIREDRVVFFGSVAPKLATFTYHARAVNSGTFVVPPLFAEAMYDKKTWAYKPQDPLVIKTK